MHDTFTKPINNSNSHFVLTNVQVFDSIKSLKVLEQSCNGCFVYDLIVLEGEGDEVGRGCDLLGENERRLSVEDLVRDFYFGGLYR